MSICKRIIAMMLCIIMLASTFASCASNVNSQVNTEPITEVTDVDMADGESSSDHSHDESSSNHNHESESSSNIETHHIHQWSEEEVLLEATCTSDGEIIKSCSCGEQVLQIIDATGHDYISVVIAPTCTDTGYTTYTCNCGDSYKDTYVDATGHSFGDWGAISTPTCTATGTERRDCSICDYYETRTTDATGHSYSSVVTAPTCTAQGYTTYTCTCNYSYKDNYVDAAGHSYSSVVTSPTCTERGYTTHTCHCGDSYIDTYVDATNHKDDGTGICAVCGNACDHIHTYSIQNTADKYLASKATCKDSATYYYSCACGAASIATFEYGDPLGHTYTSVITAPTCTAQGYTTHTCHCGNSYKDTYVDEAGHSFGNWETMTSETCTATGVERRDCTKCDHYETRTIDATGHEYTSEVTEPTCTEKGYTTYTCACGYSYKDNYVNPLCHDEIKHSAQAPTCTIIGWDAYVTCSRCDYTTYVEKPALSHDFVSDSAFATCTENGYAHKTCNRCEYETMEVIYAKGHSITYYDSKVEPTCTSVGSYSGYCDTCEEYITVELSAAGHTASELYFTNDYCGQQKLGYILCTVCEITLAEFGHSYEETIVKATCTENGQKIHTCSNCGDSYSEIISANGHMPGDWTIITPAGCTTEGAQGRYCITCETLLESISIAAIGHSYESAPAVNGITYKCSDCDNSYFVATLTRVTLTFLCDGENICDDLHIPKGIYSSLPIPTKDGFDFDGWYLDSEMKNKCLDTYTFAADTTLYGSWKENNVSGTVDTNNLVTDVPLDYTFSVTSDIELTDSNLYKYIFVKDLEEKSPNLYIVSESDGVYTIGSHNYMPGMIYQVLLREGLTFNDVVGQELWFMIEDQNDTVIDYKDGVVFIAESSVYAGFEDDEHSFIMLQNDILNVGDNAVIYGKDIYDVLLIIEVAAEGTLNDLFVYQVEIPEFDNIFSEFDAYYAGDLDIQNMEFAEDLSEQLTEQVVNSPMYAQFMYAANRMRGAVIDNYYYEVNGHTINPAFGIYNNTIIVSIEINVEFARKLVGTGKIDTLFYVTLEFRNQLSFNVNMQLSALDNFSLVVKVNNATSVNFFASTEKDEKGKVSKELSHFKLFYKDAQQSGKFTAIDQNKASLSNETLLGQLPPITIAGLTFTLELTNDFKFETVGKIGIGFEANTVTEFGIRCTPKQGITSIKSFKSDSRLYFYLLGKIEVSDEIKLELKVTILGVVSVYGSVSVEPYFIIAGMFSAEISLSSGVGSTKCAGYLEAGVKCKVNIGAEAKITWWWFGIQEKTLFKLEWKLYEDKWIWFVAGTEDVPLYFHISNEDVSIDYVCGSPINLSTFVNTSVCMQNLGDMMTYDATPSCEYYLNGDYQGVSLTEDGWLTVNSILHDEEIQVKVVHEDIHKFVNVTIKIDHSEATSAYVAPMCTTNGNTEYIYCTLCRKILEGENVVIGALGHSYSSVTTAPTCTEQGYTTHTCHCGDSYVDSYVSPNGHSYQHIVTAPTCTERGYTTHVCLIDKYSYIDTYVNATGHNYVAVVTDPTCTERGYTTHTCSACKDSYIDTYVIANDHIDNGRGICSVCGRECDHFHSYTVKNTDKKYLISEATCIAPAKYYYSCTCDAIGTEMFESGDPLGHTYTAKITAPTCTERGYTTHTCHCGDYYVDNYVKATGHKYNPVVTPPTHTTKGYTTYICMCNDSYITEYVNILPYTLTWSEGSHYSILVKRTSSPNANAFTGYLTSGNNVYYGDTLVITYVASTGYTISSSETTTYTVDDNIRSLKLTANTAANKYYIVYDANGGAGSMNKTECLYDSRISLTANKFYKHGMTFSGWKDSIGNSYSNQQSVVNLTSAPGGSVILYAQWTPITSFSVSYDSFSLSDYDDVKGDTIVFGDYVDLARLKSLGYTKVQVTQTFDAGLTSNDKGYIISRILFDGRNDALWDNSPDDIAGSGFKYTNCHYLTNATSLSWTNTRYLNEFTSIQFRFETFNPWSVIEPSWLWGNNYHATYAVSNYKVTVTFSK